MLKLRTALLAILLSNITIHPASATLHFEKWYPTYGFIFSRILHTNCTREYSAYTRGQRNNSNIDWFSGGGTHNQLAQPVVECILVHSSEFVKVNMASADVLLGLTPFVLATLGSSTAETSLLFIIAQRPLLAFCLAAGSPAVFPSRAFEFEDPVRELVMRSSTNSRNSNSGARRRLVLSPMAKFAVVVVEYVLALAAVANIVTASYDLGIKAPLSISAETMYMPILWAFLGMVIHLVGAWALFLRGHTRTSASTRVGTEEDDSWGWRGIFPRWFRNEFRPWAEHRQLAEELREETYLFYFLSWFSAVGAVCHVIMGTLVFSSLLFISTEDSLALIGRLMASVICCRIVLMFELARLRESLVGSSGNGLEVVGGIAESAPKF